VGTTNAGGVEIAGTNAAPQQNKSFQTTSSPSAVSVTQALSGTVPEFLYQLFKMLTDNNREVIEWADGTHQSRH
jgi:hypothetical protein